MRYGLLFQNENINNLVITRLIKVGILIKHHRIFSSRSLRYALYFLFASTILAGFTPSPSAKASTVYDDAYQQVDHIEVGGIGYGQTCNPVDITSTWGQMISSNPTYGDSFQEAVENGSWAVQQRLDDNGAGIQQWFVNVFWVESGQLEINFNPIFGSYYNTITKKGLYAGDMHQAMIVSNFVGYLGGSANCNYATWDAVYQDDVGETVFSTNGDSSNVGDYKGFLVVNADIHYPGGEAPDDYEGDIIETGSGDVDGDGLTLAQESLQGTSDTDMDGDTDNDGITDLQESRWFEDRDDVFCDTSTPKNCAYPNPKKKDIYVEVDWMEKSSVDLVPTFIQLETVIDAFDEQGIDLHFDTGQYGGGEQVPYEQELEFDPVTGVDFFDYKRGGDGISSPYFDEDRKGIWRYMITGDTFNDGNVNEVSSGVSNLGDDDLFISYGVLGNNTEVSGTIMHELGHSLCLAPVPSSPATEWYSGQDESCMFEGVHSTSFEDYESSMNYDKQFIMVDFSDGSNGIGDHDDWAAVMLGINDFVEFNESEPSEPTMGARGSQQESRPIMETISVDELREQAEE